MLAAAGMAPPHGEQEIMEHTENNIRTSNIGMVAWLRYCGIDPLKMEVIEDIARWSFNRDGKSLSLVEDYAQNRASVDPKRYNHYFGLVRSEMLATINPGKKRERTR